MSVEVMGEILLVSFNLDTGLFVLPESRTDMILTFLLPSLLLQDVPERSKHIQNVCTKDKEQKVLKIQVFIQ